MGLIDGQATQVLHPSKEKAWKEKSLHGQSVVVHTWSKEIQAPMKAQKPIHMEKLQGTHHTLYKDVHYNQEIVEDLGYLSIKAQLRNLAHLRSKWRMG